MLCDCALNVRLIPLGHLFALQTSVPVAPPFGKICTSKAYSYFTRCLSTGKALVEESYLGLQVGHNLSKDNPGNKPCTSCRLTIYLRPLNCTPSWAPACRIRLRGSIGGQFHGQALFVTRGEGGLCDINTVHIEVYMETKRCRHGLGT